MSTQNDDRPMNNAEEVPTAVSSTDPVWRDFVFSRPARASEPRVKGERVAFKMSTTQTPTWTVADVKHLGPGEKLGDSRRVYQLQMSNGQLYRDGEWVAQDRLLDP